MGWGRMMLLGNVGQQLDIGDLDNAVGQMRDEFARKDELDREQGQNIEQLKNENHDLKLYLGTLIRLLVARGVLKQEEVDAIVSAIEKP
jgi:tRNA A37 threonylcarbamoyltransferase TsaD